MNILVLHPVLRLLVTYVLLQALGDSCMHSDKTRRPTFDHLMASLDQLHLELIQQDELAYPCNHPQALPPVPFVSPT